MNDKNTHEVIIIGAGPTALTAAIYTTREDIETLLFERGAIGGLAAVTDHIDNYPGFADGVDGLVLAEQMRMQAERFGAVIELGEVTNISHKGNHIKLDTTSGDMYAKALLIATGSDYKKVGVPGEKEFFARGVHYCATCDGAFYRDKRLVVRGDHLRASDVLQEELKKHKDKITVYMNTTTDEIVGEDNKVVKVIGTDKKTGKKVDFPTDGVFVFVGLMPNTQFLKDSGIDLDEIGFIKTDENLMTKLKGVFAAGDVRHGATMQIASATGEGATVALRIREYMEGHKVINE